MSETAHETVIIEEIEIEKPSNNVWLVLGAFGMLIALVLGVRTVAKRRRASRPATPTSELPI